MDTNLIRIIYEWILFRGIYLKYWAIFALAAKQINEFNIWKYYQKLILYK